MTELNLKFTDERGEIRRVSVSDEIFVSEDIRKTICAFPDSRLSREHVRIERFNDKFYVSDSRSSNGTTLNGARLSEQTALRKGDRLNLGDAIEISIEIIDGNDFYQSAAVENQHPVSNESAYSPNIETSASASVNIQSVSAPSDTGSIPTVFFWLAPVFGLIILIIVGGLFFVFSGKKENAASDDNEIIYSPRNKSPEIEDSTPDKTPKPKTNQSLENSNGTNSSTPDSTNSLPTPKISADSEKSSKTRLPFCAESPKATRRLFDRQASGNGQFKNQPIQRLQRVSRKLESGEKKCGAI